MSGPQVFKRIVLGEKLFDAQQTAMRRTGGQGNLVTYRPSATKGHMANACGVDFGTSNSTVGWARPGQSALLALEDGKATLPSVVFFNADDDEVSYGRAALAGYLAGYEGRLMRSLKSLLGTSLIDGQTEVGGRALPFRMLLAHFI